MYFTNYEGTIAYPEIEHRIFTIHSVQVMIDRDLAELYSVQTKRINEQVKRNIERFPPQFCFQLTKTEFNELVANCDRFINLKHSSTLPYAFTEQGVAMLSAVLRSETAIRMSVQIIQAFVRMRKFIIENADIFHRIDRLEYAQAEADSKFERIFLALENNTIKPDKRIFYDGQVFDAYTFIADIIRSAQTSIILIDNYIDDTVLTLLSKRKEGVGCTLYTKKISKQLALDADKFIAEYQSLKLVELKEAHDRFLIIDEKILYHLGASLKDLGKKWFAFSRMDTEVVSLLSILQQLEGSL
jgi:phage regulator Rha-like protein